MPEQPYGAPRLPDDFDESEPGVPFRRPTAPDPRASATPLGRPGEFMTDPEVLSAQADWMAATGPGRLVAGPNPGEFVPAEEAGEVPGAPDEPESPPGLTVT